MLIIDDTKEVREALYDLLTVVDGLSLAAIVNGEREATEWLADNQGQWKVAIIDLLLLDGSGFNLIARARAASRDAKVIIFSEYSTPGIAKRCLEMGADAVFLKSEFELLLKYLSALGRHGSEAKPG